MDLVNRYVVNQHEYVKRKMQQPLIGFTNSKGELATWDDISVKFTNTSGVRKNFYFCNLNVPQPSFTRVFAENERLPLESHRLLFAYLMDVLKESVSIDNKKEKQAIARRFLGYFHENLAIVSMEEIQNVIDEMVCTSQLNYFFQWLHRHKMIPSVYNPRFPPRKICFRSKSGDDALFAEKNMLPDEKSLLALGSIFYEVIPAYKNNNDLDITNWDPLVNPTLKNRDAFICTMSALAMASPNRMAAEQSILSKQRLQKISEIVDGKERVVYFLNWRGSKYYLDTQKHFNQEMAKSLDRALHFIGLVTEPARVLARFYKNPNRPLKEVLGDFSPSKENLSQLNPSMDKPTILIHLGLLLGFFDSTDKIVRVTEDTAFSVRLVTRKRTTYIYTKRIVDLHPSDKLQLSLRCKITDLLIGKRIQKSNQILTGTKNNTITVSDFQDYYVSLNRDRICGFNGSQTKSIEYENALFTFTERQLFFQDNGDHFTLTPLSALHNHYKNDLKKYRDFKTIFERHGFSSEFSISPHQLRHWQNDYLEKKGLPHLLISMVSGRKSPEQTLRYIHTTDAQKASTIADIMFDYENSEGVQQNVRRRLQSKQQYDAAIECLSPTFITEVGFCSQDLTLSPCTYMNDFESQCTLCSSSCHVAHDEDAISKLKDDLMIQTKRLEVVQGALNFSSSRAMQTWYATHYRNTCMLKELIVVMSDKNIEEGSMIRIISSSNIMRITNLEKKLVTQRIFALPSTESALQAAVEAKIQHSKTSDANTKFLNFLGSL